MLFNGRNKENKGKKKIVPILAGVLAFAVAAGAIGIYTTSHPKKDQETVVTKETTAKSGNLTVGITESGNVEASSITQSFDLDWSGSGNGSTSTTSSGNTTAQNAESSGKTQESGGTEQTNSTSATTAGNSSSSNAATTSSGNSTQELVVEKVYAASGQTVKKGDSLLKLTSDSVESVRDAYEELTQEAYTEWKNAKLERDSTKVSALYEYKQKLAKNKTAKTTYNGTIASLKARMSSAKAAYNEAVKGIKNLPAQIRSLEKNIKKLKKQTGNGKNEMVGGTATSSLSLYQQQLTQKKEKLKEYKENVSALKSQYHAAQKEYTTGKIQAKATYDQSRTDGENAKSVYEVAISTANETLKTAKEAYTQAREDQKEFEKFVKGNIVRATSSGTLTSVGYSKGDSLNSGTAIATYVDKDNVTITVSVSQEDVSNIKVGDKVNVYLSAYEDTLYEAKVKSISTTSSGDTTVSYPVVVEFTGDVSKVYNGMSSEVTFVSKEVKNVVYVSNKSIFTQGTKSYVKKKMANGKTQKIAVTTGFSDGHNVEIKSGLEKGDTVLIESKVSQ